jgi:hypothetical protein
MIEEISMIETTEMQIVEDEEIGMMIMRDEAEASHHVVDSIEIVVVNVGEIPENVTSTIIVSITNRNIQNRIRNRKVRISKIMMSMKAVK